MKRDVGRVLKLVAWAKPWTSFEAKVPDHDEPSIGRLVAELGEQLQAALVECANQKKLAELAESAMRSAFEASKGFEAMAQTYSDANEPLEQLRDGLIKLRDDIDEDRDCCSYTTEIDALLALALAPKDKS